jgi:predicted RNA binding protein YcfA (HicA-like mRNA interferase family)
MVLRNKEGSRITIPRHDPIGRGLLMEIIAEAGITRDEFLLLL